VMSPILSKPSRSRRRPAVLSVPVAAVVFPLGAVLLSQSAPVWARIALESALNAAQ
jgi:hypothetical protein